MKIILQNHLIDQNGQNYLLTLKRKAQKQTSYFLLNGIGSAAMPEMPTK